MKHRRVSNRRVKQMLEELHTDEMHIVSIDSDGEHHLIDNNQSSDRQQRPNFDLGRENK
ncbi:hypothetical protein [Photobacterium sp. TY1-4]|uniref:hypothetical protein n=1 Tax=Photobacterium sp. TY1-4 TaxID=2899122 RepID=UPI0021BFF0A7|nr:hypothetical protein [Photobacterium sp. TY1-4]UXI00353.1 hypothetical protein NH461_11060 [Photobacterium sp. TY1-4]